MSTLFDQFHRVNVDDDSFIHGAARLMTASMTQIFPDDIADMISLSSFDAQVGWSDLGATKTGVAISRNFTEEAFDVDQIQGDIRTRPTGWEMAIQTALAEVTLERLSFAWEGGTVTTNTGPTPDEKNMGLGEARKYTQRRMAILHVRENDKIRAFVFRKCNLSAQETTLQYAKTGEQQTIPMRFRAFADTSVADSKARFGMVFDQV